MSKKNYYEMLGVNSSSTSEQILEGYYQSRIKFFTEHPRDSEENKEKSERIFMTILGTLTDVAERKRYDEHLKQFGLDQKFFIWLWFCERKLWQGSLNIA